VTSSHTASIVIPTRDRADYLDITLASVVPQATAAGAEVLVVSDGPNPASEAVARAHGARLIALPVRRGANVARNAGVRATEGDPIIFIDDDVDAPAGWLAALLAGVHSSPAHDVFGGPIAARLEGGGPRACGREPAPITTLDLGPVDRDVALVWSANMAVRRAAFATVGPFDEELTGHGDEEEWVLRYAAGGSRIRYVADARIEHCRHRKDATVTALARADYQHGRNARRTDVRKGSAPSLAAELRTLAGCAWHIARRRCAIGIVMLAHSAGRLREALSKSRPMSTDDFLSGTSGLVFGIRATSRALVRDALADAVALARGQNRRLRRAAAVSPRRRVLALGVEREDRPNLLTAARDELLRSKHEVRFASTTVGGRGKFENLNRLLEEHPAAGHDWLVVIDDDVALPSGFLDAFVFLAERFELRLAQPAHRARSHAAYALTRRRAGSVVRQTRFIEIGPVFAFHAATFETLLPFPELRFGWGLDAHWSAVAEEHGWPEGIIDATPVRHGLRQIASAYSREDALAEAREFLAKRPYLPVAVSQRPVAIHRSWR
jgi:GT2 family glycosyltransferase